jgi:hypothetical protein
MIEFKIKDQIVLLDDEDKYLLDNWLWHLHYTTYTTYVRGYPKGERSQGLFYLHRVLVGLDNKSEVDHENGNGLDNRRSNLRIATRSQNNANRRVVQSKSSRYKGVHFESYSGRWRAEIHKDGTHYRLGRYDTQEEAVEAYQRKAQELFGSFACVVENDVVIR